jgi:phosphate transport system substrate-binding protein
MQGRRIHRGTTAGVGVAAVALILAACSSGSSGGSSPSGGASSSSGNLSGTLSASGSTFQLPFQQAAIQSFKSVQPNMTVNYGGGGSGKGRTDLAGSVVQFAGSDTAPIPSAEVPNFKGKTVLYFPVLIGPITMSYNLSGLSKPLQLSPATIAGIFQAKIVKWNDPAIKADNPGVTLPATAITIAHRSDSSGTTQNFSQFLVDAAPSWKLGTSSTINWPANSRAGNGNSGVAQIVKSTPGAIGYVDYPDAKASGLTFASVKNQAGQFVAPSPTSGAAAAGQATIKPDLTFSAAWAPGASSYPITYQSWDLVYAKQPSATTAKLLKAYLGYLLGDGQKLLPTLNYAPLPANLDQQAKAQLSKISS